jgi:hypothetical protein
VLLPRLSFLSNFAFEVTIHLEPGLAFIKGHEIPDVLGASVVRLRFNSEIRIQNLEISFT